MRPHQILAALLAVSAFAGSPARVRADTISAAIDKVHAQYIAGLQNADAAELSMLFTEDGTQMPSNAPPVRGRLAIRADYERTFRRLRVTGGSLHTSELIRRGDSIYEIGEYAFDFEVNGKYTHSAGRYLTVWRWVSGAWKMDMNLGQQDAPV
jgi:ketosteroid isomerase-like protein